MRHVTYALRLFQRPLGLGWAPADGAPRCARAFALRSAARWRALCTSQTGVGAWYPGSGAGRRPKRSPDLSLPVCDAWRNDYLDRYTCTPHDAPGSRRAAILARGSVNKQPLQPMKVLEPAVASSVRGEGWCEHEASATCPGARSSHIAEETLHGVPPEATERGLLELPVAKLRNRAAARRCQTCLQQQGFMSKDEEATCREINQVFATEHRGDVATGAAVDIMLPPAQSATKHLNAPQSSTTPTWFGKLGGDDHSRGHLFCPLARHLSGMHPTHSSDAVVDSLRASELLECRCRPDLNADRAPTGVAVVTKCQDPACTGLVRVVVHPRHGLGGPARNSALGASSVVLRPRRGPWELELGVTETGSIQSPTR
jgi:hypothetical protein